jgi:hypothetical protein
MGFVDKKLKCDDCFEEFTYSAGEQKFFFEKGFSEPKRCKLCRAKMKS